MIGVLICLLALLTTVWGGRKSLPWGLTMMLFWGTFYGILRAQFPSGATYFCFDCSVLGLYLTQIPLLTKGDKRTSGLRGWLIVLMIWPTLLMFVPVQDFMIQIVGLRGNIFFLPVMLLGAMMNARERSQLAVGLAALNVVTLGFGLGEYFLGVQRFYPLNAATMLIYNSNDVAGYQFLRIPATFVNAHVYAGSMNCSIFLLFGAWLDQENRGWKKALLAAGIAAAGMGVLLSATRLNFVVLATLGALMLFSAGFSKQQRATVIAVILVLGSLAATNERFGRFKSLGDSASVASRINGSVNRGFFEILAEYPMGNGLGGGGTSIPSFLYDRLKQPVAMENEYAKILLEQGLVGLFLWIGFIFWFLFGSHAFRKTSWMAARRMAWVTALAYFGVGMIGLGLLTAVPQTALIMLALGWVMAPPEPEPVVVEDDEDDWDEDWQDERESWIRA